MTREHPLHRPLLGLFVGLALVTLSLPFRLVAQSQATTGIIRGVVSDPSGGPVAGAQVSVRDLQTNFRRSLVTNEKGVFVASLLPLGIYQVTARAVGFNQVTRTGVPVRVGETVDLGLALAAVELAPVVVEAQQTVVDVSKVESSTRLPTQAVSGLPNNGRNYLNLTLLTPNVAIVQGPDGDEITVAGQRGIHNNISVDGADFNNPFFGEQRGGQRPAFTFNLDAVQEMVVVAQGANAEFGRSGGGFVNVITKSGTNELRGSLHYFGKSDALSGAPEHRFPGGSVLREEPDFTQHQFGFTLGGPIKRDRAFFFVAYDQQVFNSTKQTGTLRFADAQLRRWLDTAFAGALVGDYGQIDRTNDGRALMGKVDVRLSDRHNLSLKYNYTWSEQVNGTFDVNTWGRSSNAVERDFSHAVNGMLASQLSDRVANEFRFQWAREDRPRPYTGPRIPGTNRRFPDTGMDFAAGYRFGMPFFIPIEKAFDQRIQLLDNISLWRGDHIFKVGAEWNRTQMTQTFVGFGSGRYIFSSVDGFMKYLRFGPTYVECTDGSADSSGAGFCPGGVPGYAGPLLFYLQLAPIPPLTTPEQTGTQEIPQHELALYAQDTWKPRSNVTLNYGLRWEAQIEPHPITPPDSVFYAAFIGKTRAAPGGQPREFPSDGKIASDWTMFQPRLGIAWDINNDRKQVVRASAGIFYARIASLNLASVRSTNGSRGQYYFRASFFNDFGVPPPTYPDLIPFGGGYPDHPDIVVADKDMRNPRTMAFNASYERELTPGWAASLTYSFAKTDFLSRFINRNDPVLGNGTIGPFSTGLATIPNQPSGPADTLNGISSFTLNFSGLTTLESTAKSRYHGLTFSLRGQPSERLQFQANYTLSFDKSDDDNERDPFTYRYARADSLGKEWSWSDRDQRHRVNTWFLAKLPGGILWNNRVSYYSAQPRSLKCGTNNLSTDTTAVTPGQRICPDRHILQRNTGRKDNAFFSWDVRLSYPFSTGPRGQLEAVVEIFNLTNTDNFRDPSSAGLLFSFDGTIRSGLGDPRQVQAGVRWTF